MVFYKQYLATGVSLYFFQITFCLIDIFKLLKYNRFKHILVLKNIHTKIHTHTHLGI